MRTTSELPGAAKPESGASGPAKLKGSRIIRGVAASITVCALLAPLGGLAADENPQTGAGPTADSVVATEHAYAKAYVDADADALGRILADDWEVVSGHGGWGKASAGIRKDILDAVRTHQWIHTAMDVSNIQVRLYGNTAIATEDLITSVISNGKTYKDIKEVESDIFVWTDGGWKCVLTHESNVQK